MTRALLLAVALLAGCFPESSTTPAEEVRASAIELRIGVNSLSDKLDGARLLIVFVCNVRGKSSTECEVLSDGYKAAKAGIDVAQTLVDAYAATGVGLVAVQDGVHEAEKLATAFLDKAEQLAEAADEVARSAEKLAGDRAGPGEPSASTAEAPTASPGEASEVAGAGAP